MTPFATDWLEGVGLHSGALCRVRALEAPPGTGLVLTSRKSGQSLRIRLGAVVETARRTVVGRGTWRVSTVEHLLAACHGLGVWDVVLEVEGPEIPALDGSALPFARALRRLARTSSRPPPLRLAGPCALAMGNASARATPADTTSITCRVRFDHPAIGEQMASWRGSPRGFVERVAPARTFGFLSEVDALRRAGLARGGSLDNALVFGESEPLSPERMPREPARHKLLDAMGDLALLGRPVAARITLHEPGHALTVALAKLIEEQAREERISWRGRS